ncbi:MAG: hypothetical protein ACYSUY_14405 [Planctomycetota bacterium]|jgi:hypothetical protein
MHIDGVNAGNGLALGLTKVHVKNEDDQGVPEPTANNITGENTPSVQTSDSTSETSEELAGVILNLMDGHFKGVADVRLRINFQEEIEAIEAAERQAIAEEQFGQILESVTVTGDDEPPLESTTALVAESQEQTDEPAVTDLDGVAELQEALTDDINAIKESYFGTLASSDELADDLWAVFNNFVDSMLELYPPPEEAPPEEPKHIPPLEPEPAIATVLESEPVSESEPVPESEPLIESEPVTDPEPEPTPDIQGYLEDLETAFSTAIDDLIEALNMVSVLPELSGPSGNGTAYQKFVSIYNEL